MTSQPIQQIPKREMRSFMNCLLHGIYLMFYGVVKNASFPFFNYARFLLLSVFSQGKIKSSALGDGVTIWFPWRVNIGHRSSLNQGVIIDGFGGVRIGEGVRIAAYVCINTADHGFSDPDKFIMDQDYVVGPVVIEDDVWIGTGATINKGVRIGKGAVIGSGSVVNKDIPPYSIAVGVPCRPIKSRRTSIPTTP